MIFHTLAPLNLQVGDAVRILGINRITHIKSVIPTDEYRYHTTISAAATYNLYGFYSNKAFSEILLAVPKSIKYTICNKLERIIPT
jgi:hypothetical protein